MPYYTIIVWEEDETAPGSWEDTYGFTTRKEALDEIEYSYDHYPRGHVKIVMTDGTTSQLIAARDNQPAPKTGRAYKEK